MFEATLDLDKVIELCGIESAAIIIFHSLKVALYISFILLIELHLLFIYCRFRQFFKCIQINHIPTISNNELYIISFEEIEFDF